MRLGIAWGRPALEIGQPTARGRPFTRGTDGNEPQVTVFRNFLDDECIVAANVPRRFFTCLTQTMQLLPIFIVAFTFQASSFDPAIQTAVTIHKCGVCREECHRSQHPVLHSSSDLP